MSTVINQNGQEIEFEVAVNLMDDEIREKLHMELSPCTNQEFFAAYEQEHYLVYGEGFQVN